MRILVTGSTGMVGKNILENPSFKLFNFLTPSRLELNLLDKAQVENYLKQLQPDMIIHMAGVVGGIQTNMASPVRFLVDNMQMGLNIITSAQSAGIPKFMNFASSCMYPKNISGLLSEELILKGELEPTNEGYALAKITNTRLCEYIRKEDPSYQYKTVIPCNLYGRYDKFNPELSHMLPAVIKKIADAKSQGSLSVDIWGDGMVRREFMYAGDLADFIFFAIERFAEMPQNINVGLGCDYTINEYYQKIAKVIGYDGEFIHDLSKPEGMKKKLTDDSRLKKFGWQPVTSLSDGIKKTYEYYLDEIANN